MTRDAQGLDLRQQVARLLVVRASGHLGDAQRRYPRWELTNAELRRLLQGGVGGVILLGGSAAELRLRTLQLERWAGRSLLLCADVEEGVGQRFEGASWLVPPLALASLHAADPRRALDLARRYGRCTGRQARRLGLNWVLAPVCDVNNNPLNPVINVRAWGEDPATAAALACAFLEGAQAEDVLCCAKHFPGHGDTASDSHMELPLMPHDPARLDQVELPPFRAAIEAGVASVMTAHLQLPALDAERPATLSGAVLDHLLRRRLGFEGLVVTDALVMEAIAGRWGAGEAAVLAFEAGADILLMPGDADAAIEGLLEAIQAGRISRARLAASLDRRGRALASVSARASRLRSDELLEGLDSLVTAEEEALAGELVRLSLQGGGEALLPPGPGVNLIRVDSALANAFLPLMAPALQRPAARGYAACLIDPRSPSPWSDAPEAPLALDRLPAGPVLLQLFIRGNPFSGNADGGGPWPAAVRQLLAAGRLAGLAVYGSPYLWQSLAPLLPADLPAAYGPGQMPLAQALLLERLGLAAEELEGGFTD